MIQVITKEWEITKAYIYDVALPPGLIKLDWDDFEVFAETHRPVVAVRNEGNISVKKLTKKAMAEVLKRCPNNLSSFIVLVSYKEGDELMIDEMNKIRGCLTMFANENIEIKWGISPQKSLIGKRCVFIFAFE